MARSLAHHHQPPLTSIALPLAVLGLLTGVFAVQSGLLSFKAPSMPLPLTVSVPAGGFEYREAGEFFRDGFAVDGPKVTRQMGALEIMKYQVSTADYDQCVAENACPPRESTTASDANLPVTGVNFDDATAYAQWFSDKTGTHWRLPKDEELAFAAGSKFPDDALGIDPDSKNPALRWLADYEREAERKASRNPEPQPFGHFGESELGLSDFAGNVWEWTGTCNRRVTLSSQGVPVSENQSCGIYMAVGKHRSPLSSFVRDPKGGGCSVGTPPDNVGFRLVRDNRWYAPLLFAFTH